MRRFAPIYAALMFVSAASAVTARPAVQRTPQQVAAALQAKYDNVRDFTADFTQQYESGILRKKSTERGKLQIKKPGKMRWDYTAPDKKLFVSDGSRIYLWVPADNQVTVSDVPKEADAATAMQFLTGRGHLERDFTVSFTQNPPAGTYGLRLDPKRQERDYDWLQLEIDQQSMQIRRLTAADRQGGQSTFTFTNLKENVGLADTTFTFKIPRGADVINAGASTR
jgi:outer membrane lipoprotein carrier protein